MGLKSRNYPVNIATRGSFLKNLTSNFNFNFFYILIWFIFTIGLFWLILTKFNLLKTIIVTDFGFSTVASNFHLLQSAKDLTQDQTFLTDRKTNALSPGCSQSLLSSGHLFQIFFLLYIRHSAYQSVLCRSRQFCIWSITVFTMHDPFFAETPNVIILQLNPSRNLFQLFFQHR